MGCWATGVCRGSGLLLSLTVVSWGEQPSNRTDTAKMKMPNRSLMAGVTSFSLQGMVVRLRAWESEFIPNVAMFRRHSMGSEIPGVQVLFHSVPPTLAMREITASTAEWLD